MTNESDIAKGEETTFTSKIIRIQEGIIIRSNVVFNQCVVFFECKNYTAIRIDKGKLLLHNCHIVIKQEVRGPVINNVGGDIILKNCRMEDARLINSKDIENDNDTACFISVDNYYKNEKVSASLMNCKFINCSHTILRLLGNIEVKITECKIKKHKGHFLFLSSNLNHKGILVADTNFEGCSMLTDYNANEIFSNHDKKNALIYTQYSSYNLLNCTFTDINNSVLIGDACDGNHGIRHCTFQKIFLGYHNEIVLKTGGGTNLISNCVFDEISGISIGNIGELVNEQSYLDHCRFVKCNGNIQLDGIFMTDCELNHCVSSSDLISLKGKASFGQHIISEIENCTFINCKAQDNLIAIHSNLSKNGICSQVVDCKFIGCMAYEGEFIKMGDWDEG